MPERFSTGKTGRSVLIAGTLPRNGADAVFSGVSRPILLFLIDF